MGRGVIFLLVVSLAANVFLGGFVAGRIFSDRPDSSESIAEPRRPHDGPRRKRPPFRGENDGFGNLAVADPQTRDVFRDVFRQAKDEARARRRAARDARDALREALGRQPWDRAAVEAAVKAMNDAQDDQRALLSTKLIDAFEALSPEQRARLLEAQRADHEQRRRRRERFRDRRGGDGER